MKSNNINKKFKISSYLDNVGKYQLPDLSCPTDLKLDGNEGSAPDISRKINKILSNPEIFSSYPDVKPLEQLLAKRVGVNQNQLMVTAGGDEAIDRICRITLDSGQRAVLPVPTFSMYELYIPLAKGTIKEVEWNQEQFPTESVISAIDNNTSLIVMVSPNNPTGSVISADDLRRVAQSSPDIIVLVDLAYEEFADEKLTAVALEYENCIIVRSLSKSWGLAGLRVGYAISNEKIISLLRKAGGPYSVSSLSVAIAEDILREKTSPDEYILEIKRNRNLIYDILKNLGADPLKSQGNFVLSKFKNVDWVREGLAGLGIAVRAFPNDKRLGQALRITVPPKNQIRRLLNGLQTVLKPDAILFDMDGVLGDVSKSYRQSIIETAKCFGCDISLKDISALKQKGKANNDWLLTQSLLNEKGIEIEFKEVKKVFENIYQGTDGTAGLKEKETLIPSLETLLKLKEKVKLAVVTGRPRSDAEYFLKRFNLTDIFEVVIVLEDAELKPSPKPLLMALEKLGVKYAWMIGDTTDDITAARGAGVVPLGILAPGESDNNCSHLLDTGAGKILTSLKEIIGLLK